MNNLASLEVTQKSNVKGKEALKITKEINL